jgi:hypothetical protein
MVVHTDVWAGFAGFIPRHRISSKFRLVGFVRDSAVSDFVHGFSSRLALGRVVDLELLLGPLGVEQQKTLRSWS